MTNIKWQIPNIKREMLKQFVVWYLPFDICCLSYHVSMSLSTFLFLYIAFLKKVWYNNSAVGKGDNPHAWCLGSPSGWGADQAGSGPQIDLPTPASSQIYRRECHFSS
jgi:hypothetical protein